MRRLAIRFALWILRHYRYELEKVILKSNPFPEVTDQLLDRAGDIVRTIEGTFSESASGEAKRHSALARIKKEFPNLGNRTIAAAIELAVREVK